MPDSPLTLRVVRIVDEAPDTRSFWLESTDGRAVPFRPGQFLTLLIRVNSHEVRRSYSLSSLPGDGLRITIRRVANGAVSRQLLDTLQLGDLLQSLLPAGRFTLKTEPDGPPRDLLLFGAGSGITPLLPLLRQAVAEEPKSHVTLLYSNTHSSRIIFREELAQLHQQYASQFALIHLLSQPDHTDTKSGGRVEPGRLSNLRLQTLLPTLLRHDAGRAQVFICGPADYMRMIRFTLLVTGFRDDQIRRENFVVHSASPTPLPAFTQARTIQVVIRGQAFSVHVPAYVSILQAALDAGIRLPYSCRGGRCSTCAAHCSAGEVRMTINDVLTDQDRAEGWILTCTGYPATDDVVITV
ncbi:2Fe-2S iron-sulfur cluster-binding protein [Spirosoma arcticum]